MLKQKSDDSWIVSSDKDVEKALELMRERNTMVEQIEKICEEQYELSTLRKEALGLLKAVQTYLLEQDKNFEDDQSILTIVKPKKWRWNALKLAKLIPKPMFISVCDLTPNPEKIEEAVKAGKLKEDDIASAFEADPIKPYIKHSVKRDKSGTEDEVNSFAAAMQ